MELRISTTATIKHLNPRKVGPEDDKLLALDIKLTGTVDSVVLTALLGSDSRYDTETAFWRDDDDRNPRFLGLGECKIQDVEAYGLLVRIGGIELRNASARKFSFLPIPGACVELTWQITANNLESRVFSMLAEYLEEDLSVLLASEQQELDLTGTE